jgi:ABC-type phosphate transport system substrate-binding protein
MRRFWTLIVVLFVGLLPGSTARAAQTEFVVIVNESNPITSISREELAKIFLKQETAWPDGQAIAPVDQAPDSPVRATFTREILRRSVGAVKSYWEKQIFSGSAVPPVEKSSNDSVSSYVITNRGAIGYVLAWALDSGKALVRLPAGVKVLRIE